MKGKPQGNDEHLPYYVKQNKGGPSERKRPPCMPSPPFRVSSPAVWAQSPFVCPPPVLYIQLGGFKVTDQLEAAHGSRTPLGAAVLLKL